jgi:phage baseplate assembly protein W
VIFQTPQVFNSTFTTQDQTKNQLINFILTDPGERFFNPNFGSGIRSVLFQQDTDFEGLEVTLAEKIENFVQNIKVNNINIVEGESNQINILINYSINNIQDTLTINLDNETL